MKAETATNYEIGYKAEMFARTLRLNAATFDTEYKDLQFQSFGPRPGIVEFGIFRTVNLQSARARGAELEADWKPIHGLTLSGSYGYLDAKYIKAIVLNSAYPIQSGQEMARAPRNKYTESAQYEFSLGNIGSLTSSIDYEYTGQQRGAIEPYANQPAYGVANARIAWDSPDRRAEVAIWSRNLANTQYVSHLYTIGGEAIGAFGDPMTFGATLSLKN